MVVWGVCVLILQNHSSLLYLKLNMLGLAKTRLPLNHGVMYFVVLS